MKRCCELKQMRWYHGTDRIKRDHILVNGFTLNSGILGKGVYFSSSLEGASIFGQCILKTLVNTSETLVVDFSKWIVKYPNEDE